MFSKNFYKVRKDSQNLKPVEQLPKSERVDID